MTERENALKVFRGEIPEWIPCYTQATHYLMAPAYADIEKPQTVEGYDWFGIHWLPVEASANLTHPDIFQEPVFDDVSKWEEKLVFPDLETAVDWDLAAKQMNEQCGMVDGNKIITIMLEHGLFERLTLLMGFENSLVALYEDPEACQDYCKAMADFKIALMDKLFEVCPRIEMIDWHDDLGSQSSALMSPEKWEEIFAEQTARIAEHVHSKGRLFMYHSCGRVDQIMGTVIKHVKPDGWNLLQTCNDQEYIKRTFGKEVVLVCGLATQEFFDIPDPKEEDIRAEVDRTIRVLGPGGKFMAGQYLPGGFWSNGLDVPGIVVDQIQRRADYYKDSANCVFP